MLAEGRRHAAVVELPSGTRVRITCRPVPEGRRGLPARSSRSRRTPPARVAAVRQPAAVTPGAARHRRRSAPLAGGCRDVDNAYRAGYWIVLSGERRHREAGAGPGGAPAEQPGRIAPRRRRDAATGGDCTDRPRGGAARRHRPRAGDPARRPARPSPARRAGQRRSRRPAAPARTALGRDHADHRRRERARPERVADLLPAHRRGAAAAAPHRRPPGAGPVLPEPAEPRRRPDLFTGGAASAAAVGLAGQHRRAAPACCKQVVQHRRRTGVDRARRSAGRTQAISRRSLSQLEALERDAIIRSLRDNNGNRRDAARSLGMSRATIYRKIHDYGIR